MADVTIGTIIPDFIIRFDIIYKNEVMLPEWINNPARVDPSVHNIRVTQVEYTFRATDAEKYSADKILLAHSKVAFVDNINKISGDVWMTKLTAKYTPINWAKPWEITVTLISDNLTKIPLPPKQIGYKIDTILSAQRKYNIDAILVNSIFGYNKLGASGWNNQGNWKVGSKFVFVSPLTINSISCYMQDDSPPTGFRFAIYSDNSGSPDVLIAQTEIGSTSNTSPQWYTLNFSPSIILPAGTYWIIELDSGGFLNKFYDFVAESDKFAFNENSWDTFINPFGIPTLENKVLSIYAS